MRRARELAARWREDVLLVLNREIETAEPELAKVSQFTRSLVPAETFYLYRINYPRTAPALEPRASPVCRRRRKNPCKTPNFLL